MATTASREKAAQAWCAETTKYKAMDVDLAEAFAEILDADRAARVDLRTQTFQQELQKLINYHSRESGSDTPDFILANYLIDCLAAFDKAVKDRARWYGHEQRVPAGACIPPRPD